MKANDDTAVSKMRHTPCPHRRRETRGGVTLDWCYAIGCCEIGDMPCEYCRDGKEKKGRIYICGPMGGMPGFNYPQFDAAAKKLAAKGWEVVNPADIGRLYARRSGKPLAEMASDPAIFANLLKDEISTLRECDAIFLLDGWNNSTGAKTELFHALERNMSVILQGDLDSKEADGAQ